METNPNTTRVTEYATNPNTNTTPTTTTTKTTMNTTRSNTTINTTTTTTTTTPAVATRVHDCSYHHSTLSTNAPCGRAGAAPARPALARRA
jgi:hypothetical protein